MDGKRKITAYTASSAPVARSNRLPTLISEIKKFEVLGRNHGKASLAARLDEGERLAELKESVEHGRWLPLLKELGIHEMRARRYMRLAEHRELIGAKSDLESDFNLTDALNCIMDFEEQKEREADKEFQARRRKREEYNREQLANAMANRADADAKIQEREEDYKRKPARPEPAAAPKAPLPVAKAIVGLANYVKHFLERVGLDQRAEFLRHARGILDSMEEQDICEAAE